LAVRVGRSDLVNRSSSALVARNEVTLSKDLMTQDLSVGDPQYIRKALRLEYVLISYNTLEAIASVGFGLLAGSIALIGFGFDSVIEVSAACILIWRLTCHTNKEDEERREKKALFFVGFTFFLLAAYILYESLTKLIGQKAPQETLPGIVIATLSLIVMPVLGLKKRHIARKIGSKALEADAVETLVCAYLSFALLLGLGLHALFGWWWADPVAALAMLPLILHEGREAVAEARI